MMIQNEDNNMNKQTRLNQIRILMSDGKQRTRTEIQDYIKSYCNNQNDNPNLSIGNDIFELTHSNELQMVSRSTYIATSTLKEKYIKLPDQDIKKKLIIATELYNEKARNILKQSRSNETDLAYSLINNFCTDIINDCKQLQSTEGR